jgi:hypothetical protein
MQFLGVVDFLFDNLPIHLSLLVKNRPAGMQIEACVCFNQNMNNTQEFSLTASSGKKENCG